MWLADNITIPLINKQIYCFFAFKRCTCEVKRLAVLQVFLLILLTGKTIGYALRILFAIEVIVTVCCGALLDAKANRKFSYHCVSVYIRFMTPVH